MTPNRGLDHRRDVAGRSPGGTDDGPEPVEPLADRGRSAPGRRVDVRGGLPSGSGGTAGLGGGARTRPRPRDPAARATGRGEPGGARAAASRARSASRSPSRAARCRRSSTPATSSWAKGAGSTARPCRREMPDKQLFTFRTPVGVAAIITAGNFPVAVPSWYLVPALLCGNAVVWKPAEYTPATAEAFAQLFLHAGFPAGAFNMVLADGTQTFDGLERALDEHLVDKVGFTGSTDVGRRIGELCGRHLQSPCLELGGQEPARRDARRRPGPGGRGRAVQRVRDGRPAMHVARHRDRARRRPRRLHGPVRQGGPRGADRRPDERRPVRPDDQRALPGPVPDVARADRGRIIACGARRAPGASPRPILARGSSATRTRALLPPHRRRRRHDGRRALRHGDVRADRGRGVVRDVRRGDGAGERPRVRTVERRSTRATRCTRSGSASGSRRAW